MQNEDMNEARDQLVDLLRKTSGKVAFAESCTAGLCSARLAQVDGISNHLVGSMVTYREVAKKQWLQVSDLTINQHTCESAEVVEEMLLGLRTIASEADWLAAVVGHLADGQDCFAEIAVGGKHNVLITTKRFVLEGQDRLHRQAEATNHVYKTLSGIIESSI